MKPQLYTFLQHDAAHPSGDEAAVAVAVAVAVVAAAAVAVAVVAAAAAAAAYSSSSSTTPSTLAATRCAVVVVVAFRVKLATLPPPLSRLSRCARAPSCGSMRTWSLSATQRATWLRGVCCRPLRLRDTKREQAQPRHVCVRAVNVYIYIKRRDNAKKDLLRVSPRPGPGPGRTYTQEISLLATAAHHTPHV